MSLKGNVAGLGLGELVQSLARGGRDGALTLYGDGLHAVLGFQEAQLFLMPSEDESEDLWRTRCRDAWIGDPSPQLESTRRTAIAHAARLETLYGMLESENLHFSFWPGQLAQYRESQKAKRSAKEEEKDGVGIPGYTEEDWGSGLQVEGLLLEHARLADEAKTGPACVVTQWDVPLPLDDSGRRAEGKNFLAHCDGHSTVLEITDRLGWPVRQGFVQVASLVANGRLRLCSPRELLAAALTELDGGSLTRAASRFVGWIRSRDCGPLETADADQLVRLWDDGRLQDLLAAMPAREARGVLRRLDLTQPDRRAMIARWGALHGTQRSDPRVTLHWLVLRASDSTPESKPPLAELLRLARYFHDQNRRARMRTVLRIADGLKPSRLNHRLELGQRMVEAGLVAEGSSWLLAAARELIDLRQGEKALGPLRTVLEADPGNRTARGLQMQARLRSTSSRRRRRNTVIGLALGLVFSVAALVEVRSEQHTRRSLEDVTALIGTPVDALAKLDELFPADDSPRVSNLRALLQQHIRDDQRETEDAWLARFEEVRQECSVGDPLLGLRRALALPPPPATVTDQSAWPQRFEIFHGVIERFQERSAEVDLALDGSHEERHAEERLALLLGEVLELLEKEGDGSSDVLAFRSGVGAILTGIRMRQEDRAIERERREQHELEQKMDLLLAAARAHHQAGDIERAQSTYDHFLELDDTGELAEFLAPEIERMRAHHNAYLTARDRSVVGDHSGALAALTARATDGAPACPNPAEHMLPWRVKSEPDGARALFPDGLERVTPFTFESAFGEHIKIRFGYEGCETRELLIDGPSDLLVRMHQLPERHWKTEYRVEALPLGFQNDHIVCDRRGRLARLDEQGNVVWEREFPTLSGIARTPVFLPAKRGVLLVVAEDGKAWLVDASNGDQESAWSAGSPLVEGPLVRSRGATARFRDGRIAEWTDANQPAIYNSTDLFAIDDKPLSSRGTYGTEATGSLVALFQKAGAGSSLASTWTDWVVEVYEEEYVVRRAGASRSGFSASRHGNWAYVAWEMPNPRLPRGRLWVSDEAGLRSYLPPR